MINHNTLPTRQTRYAFLYHIYNKKLVPIHTEKADDYGPVRIRGIIDMRTSQTPLVSNISCSVNDYP